MKLSCALYQANDTFTSLVTSVIVSKSSHSNSIKPIFERPFELKRDIKYLIRIAVNERARGISGKKNPASECILFFLQSKNKIYIYFNRNGFVFDILSRSSLPVCFWWWRPERPSPWHYPFSLLIDDCTNYCTKPKRTAERNLKLSHSTIFKTLNNSWVKYL